MPKQKTSGSRREPVVLRLTADYRLHASDESRLIENFYIALDTPVALSCYLMFKYEEYEQLVCKDIDSGQYIDPYLFRDDFAAVSFLRKNENLKTTFNLKDIALTQFKLCEDVCKETNLRIDGMVSGEIQDPVNYAYLLDMRRKISHILGSFDIVKVFDFCKWGPGVTLSVKGQDTSASQKFDVDCDITRDAYDLYGASLRVAYPLWLSDYEPNFRIGNKIITVPKNAKTDRTIAIEPGINTWLQLGIGKLIRERLRRAGYNLDSDLKNQRGAYKASLDDSLATVDYKAASDTISTSLVKFLLPEEWFIALDAARSHYYSFDNQEYHKFEKFSTMGNGFTFELESLIFVVLGIVVTTKLKAPCIDISIFGDDLVIPSQSYTEVAALSSILGFTVNQQKSFFTGYFRESCGSYYFNGVDVKPLFLKKKISRLKDVYRFANSLRWLAHTRNNFYGCDVKLRSLWSLTTHLIPQTLRLVGAVSCGDSVIHGNFHESLGVKRHKSWDGFLVPSLVSVPLDYEKDSLGLFLQRLSKRSVDTAERNSIPFRARTKIILKRIFVFRWYELGTWF